MLKERNLDWVWAIAVGSRVIFEKGDGMWFSSGEYLADVVF